VPKNGSLFFHDLPDVHERAAAGTGIRHRNVSLARPDPAVDDSRCRRGTARHSGPGLVSRRPRASARARPPTRATRGAPIDPISASPMVGRFPPRAAADSPRMAPGTRSASCRWGGGQGVNRTLDTRISVPGRFWTCNCNQPASGVSVATNEQRRRAVQDRFTQNYRTVQIGGPLCSFPSLHFATA
jgi:hypothetical protein